MPAPTRVLVVDPSETSCEQTAKQFSQRPGIEVVWTTDGPKASAALASGDFDIALIDQRTPRVDGRTAVAWASRRDRRNLLLLTANRLTERWPAISTYVQAYDTLLKPIRRGRADTILEAHRRARTPARVLIVDPTLATTRVTATLLKRSRFIVSTVAVERGDQAIALALEEPFDLALVSLHVDDLPGMEVSIGLAELQHPPRIVMIGNPGDPRRLATSTLAMFGAHAYLRKPFAGHQLDAAIHTAFGLWKPYLSKALATAWEQRVV